MRLPVSIITGFLGSGKTTLLNRLLQDPAMAGAAVIINEFGEIGLDHLLIATPNENTVLLASGCICCTVRGDLVNTLRDLDAQRRKGDLPPFDRVLIETTGLADPVPIVQTVVTDEKLAPTYMLDSVITLVDGVNGLQQLETQPESVKQAALADRLLITKTDLPEATAVASLTDRLAVLNPGAELLRVKGLLNVDGEPVAVHAVQTLIHEPVTLAQWPDAERRSRLVFITRGMDRAALESTLDVLRWRSMATAGGVPKPDPQAYARFLAAMEKMR